MLWGRFSVILLIVHIVVLFNHLCLINDLNVSAFVAFENYTQLEASTLFKIFVEINYMFVDLMNMFVRIRGIVFSILY